MSEEAECEVPRSATAAVTPSAAAHTVGGRRRVVLRTEDGVRIEAAYEPFAGDGRPLARDAGASAGLSAGTGPHPEPGYGRRSVSRSGSGSGTDGALDRGALVLAHGFTGSVDRPALRRAVRAFARHAAVVSFSFRGHGGSGGHSTLGDREVLDLAAAVRWARSLGHRHVTTVGFSMGGSVAVRHAALYHPYRPAAEPAPAPANRPDSAGRSGRTEARGRPGPRAPVPGFGPGSHGLGADGIEPGAHADGHADAVVSVSAPARWYYRGTAPMRRLHWAVERPLGRLVSRYGLRTRIHPRGWDPVPLPPVAAAAALAPVPLLVVHGDRDPYFPLDHPRSLAAAGDPDHTELWLVPGFGHAENAAEPALLHLIGSWTDARYEASRAARHDGTARP